jgi:leucyl aminopeptidase
MQIDIITESELNENLPTITIGSGGTPTCFASTKEQDYISKKIAEGEKTCYIDRLDSYIAYINGSSEKEVWRHHENMRRHGHEAQQKLAKAGYSAVQLDCRLADKGTALAFIEGMLLGSYSFTAYISDQNKAPKSISKLAAAGIEGYSAEIDELVSLSKAVFHARDWVNEPVMSMNSLDFAERISRAAHASGLKAVIYGQDWIEEQGMGGLLAVNKGSVDEPYFVELTWEPEEFIGRAPIVLVGKGIVYDTGGISLKPSNSMEWMKSDMGGAAAVAAAMIAAAENRLPMRVIGLIPITDNRPCGNAYVPGDVVKMRNGKTVEVLNTDAEGRMILADALSYASEFAPKLVIDAATLTGAAAAALGEWAVAAMGTADTETFMQLEESGYATCERIARFPFWDEYAELIKSDIADMKNIGGPVAGAITAGKFLENFTSYPWVHLDISGSAFLKSASSYRGKGGSGFGVRLLYHFLKSQK